MCVSCNRLYFIRQSPASAFFTRVRTMQRTVGAGCVTHFNFVTP